MPTARSLIATLLLCVCALGCTGKIGQSPTTPSGAGGRVSMPTPDSQGNLPYAAPQPAPAALPARAWRLTHAEYRRSVRALTGVEPDTSGFEAEADGGLFSNISNVGFVRLQLAGNYYDAAAQIADTMAETQLRSLAAPCGNLTAACKSDFIRGALTRAYRRAPTAEEVAEMGELFDLAVPSGEPALPFRSVIQGVLTAPPFLYRTEIGTNAADASFRLTGHEVASFLSYSLLGEPPPASLLAAADRGELTEPGALRTNVDALLGLPAASEPLRAFLFQWLTLTKFNDDLYKFPDLFPGFDGARTAMLDEANAFFAANGAMNGTIASLLTGSIPTATGALGSFYAGPGAGAGARTGWLGLGAFLSVAAHANLSSPTLRGHFVRERLLCQHMSVPPNVPVLEDIEGMGAAPTSTRELYGLHAKQADCAGCHEALDQVGFVFESFDGAGRFRTEELFRNQTVPTPVDTRGKLVNTDVNRPLANHADLAEALASSAWVRECAAIQAFRYTFGFGDDVARGLPPVVAGYQALTAGGTWRDLLAAVASSPSTYERNRN
jgi:hypothetical protein